MTFWRDGVCWLLLLLAIGCFVAGAFPQWSDSVDPANGDRVSACRLGIWSSPSYIYEHRDGANGEFFTESRVNFLSWSLLLVLIGFGSLAMIRSRLGRASRHQGQGQRV